MKRILWARAKQAPSFAMGIATTIPSSTELPESIQWMPPGPQDVTPDVGGKRVRLQFTTRPEHAQILNGQLQDMRRDAAQGIGDEPYLDFNHNDDERAAEVLELYWGGDDPKTGGIRARVKWSAAGSAAVLGRNYRRFSPQWGFDPDTHEPVAIGSNLGGLVNRAAFNNIAHVTAKNGAATPTPQNNMNDADFRIIVAEAFKPIGERMTALEARLPATAAAANPTAAAAAAPDIRGIVETAVASGLKPVVDRFNKLEADTQTARAAAAVQPHITRGAIAPQDNDTIKFWQDSWIANAKGAEAQMARLPALKTGKFHTQQANTAAETAAAGGAEPADQILAAAREIAAKGAGKVNLAEALIATARSAEGQEKYMQFRQTFGERPGKNN